MEVELFSDIGQYAVAIYYDAYTPLEFFTQVIMRVMKLDLFKASAYMVFIMENDSAIIGTFTRDIAFSRASKIIEMADLAGYPLYAEPVKFIAPKTA